MSCSSKTVKYLIEETSEKGVRDGLWEFFDEDGNLTGTDTYRNGELVLR